MQAYKSTKTLNQLFYIRKSLRQYNKQISLDQNRKIMFSFQNKALQYAALGGIILGIACIINYVIRGKDTGMTRIAYNIATMKKSQLPQMFTMFGGMLTVSSLMHILYGNGNYNGFQPFGPDSKITQWTTTPGFLLAGFLVGFGAKLSGGCTSGHGLCGLPRLSLKSLAAVCMFLIAGFAIGTYAYKNGLGVFVDNKNPVHDEFIHFDHNVTSRVGFGVGISMFFFAFYLARQNKKTINSSLIFDHVLVYIIGGLFAAGLLVSGMARRENVLHFLQIGDHWNPALLLVLGFGVGANLIPFIIMKKRGTSLNGNKVFDPKQKDQIVDWRVIVGGLCFGLGWGLGGLCPGPFYVLFSVFTFSIQIIWGIGFVSGALVGAKLHQKTQPSIVKDIASALHLKV